MSSVVTVVDGYIESLLSDTCIRIGLYPARTKALEWGKLLSTDECNDNAQLVENIKKATYVVHYLLNAKKLTDSFSKYFEKRTDMSFNENNVALTDEKGSIFQSQDLPVQGQFHTFCSRQVSSVNQQRRK